MTLLHALDRVMSCRYPSERASAQ